MKLTSKYAAITLLLFLRAFLSPVSNLVIAQDIRVNARLEDDVILIGEQTTLTLEATVPPSCLLVWPQVGDTLVSQIEVVRKSPVDTVPQANTEGTIRLTQQLVITSFDSGYIAIPPFLFVYQTAGTEDYQTGETEAMLLQVDNPKVNMAEDIKDIKGPLRAPVTFAEIWPWLLCVLLLAGAIILFLYYRRRRKKAQPLVVFRRKPSQPPHVIALDELEKLKAKKLWQSGKVKQYHTELTDIVRNYIAARFGIHATEMVTHEILESIEKTPVGPSIRLKLRETLELADLVKFAKENPLPDEHERSLNQAVDFVKESVRTTDETPAEATDSQMISITEDQK